MSGDELADPSEPGDHDASLIPPGGSEVHGCRRGGEAPAQRPRDPGENRDQDHGERGDQQDGLADLVG
jgi:hypothetical protein